MAEPLHIADYYKDGKKNYKTSGERPRHFTLLEQWQEDEGKPEASRSNINAKRKNVNVILNEDSCFWAHDEEALISCNLMNGGSPITSSDTQAHKEKLKNFEDYVYKALKNYAVSPEIFLGKSTFMRWWDNYQTIMEDPDCSLLGQFMVNRDYLRYGNEDLVLI